MKHYPKTYEDIYQIAPKDARPSRISSTFGSADALLVQFREFYKEAHVQLFDIVVRQVWLEQQFVYGGVRRKKRRANSSAADWAFGYFMSTLVGISQKPITVNYCFRAIATYLKDLFPEFLQHNPFKEPEYYKYPYKHVTLDFLLFVYKVEDRLEMLEYAEKRGMSFSEFANWATNAVLSYNNEIKRDVYAIGGREYMWKHIQNKEAGVEWYENKLAFE